MFKIRGPWDGKQNLCLFCQVTLSSPQILKKNNSLAAEGGQDDYLFSMKAPIFFLMPNLNKYCLAVEICHLWVTHCITLHAATATECHKKQTGHAIYWNSEYMYLIEQ